MSINKQIPLLSNLGSLFEKDKIFGVDWRSRREDQERSKTGAALMKPEGNFRVDGLCD